MGKRANVTLQDVARHAGVSLATASRVLSGSRHPVSAENHRRVEDAARHLHYVPNAQARALAAARNTTVGLIVHDVSDPYFAEIVRGAIRVASQQEHLVMICNTYRCPQREREYLSALRAQRVQALLVAGSGFVDPQINAEIVSDLEQFEASGGRVVLVGRSLPGISAVLPDNVGGSEAMGRALLQLGHRHIGVVAGPSALITVQDRLEGLSRAMSKEGLVLDEQQVVETGFTREGGYQGVRKLLADCPETTVVYALNDAMAMGAMTAIREMGLRVPEDISLAGFDDVPNARDLNPALTTVRVPMEEMGERAMTLALKDAAGQHVERFSSEIIFRGSTISVRY